MRIHALECNGCKGSRPVVDPEITRIMPEGWYVLTEKQGYLGEKELHFCSLDCLETWIERDKNSIRVKAGENIAEGRAVTIKPDGLAYRAEAIYDMPEKRME